MSYDNLRVLFFFVETIVADSFSSSHLHSPNPTKQLFGRRTVCTWAHLRAHSRHTWRLDTPCDAPTRVQAESCLSHTLVCVCAPKGAFPWCLPSCCVLYVHRTHWCDRALPPSATASIHTCCCVLPSSIPGDVDWTGSCGALASGFHLDCQLSSLARSILYVFPMCAGGLCSFMFQVRWWNSSTYHFLLNGPHSSLAVT